MVTVQDVCTKQTPADDVKNPSSKTSARICPMLKLHTGCPLMVTENTEVRGGVANGTQATFKGITKQKEVSKLAAMMLLGQVCHALTL
jgi:hypothetical protein